MGLGLELGSGLGLGLGLGFALRGGTLRAVQVAAHEAQRAVLVE